MTDAPELLADLHALDSDAVVAPLDKELIVATGADRIRFLHGLVTGAVAATPVGAGCHAALLTAKAHVIADLRVFVRDQDVFLLVEAGEGETVAGTISRYAIMDDFAASVATDHALLRILGPRAADRLRAAGVDVGALAGKPAWSHADVTMADSGVWLAAVREWGQDGFWLAGEPGVVGRLHAALRAAGVREIAPASGELARIAAREPRWGREITSDYFPMEVGLGDAIDYSKGCFLGQEPIVRIRDRGHVNYRLAPLEIAAAETVDPAPGDVLQSEARPKAGRLTSFARRPDGGGVGLALVHVSVTPGTPVQALHEGRPPVVARVVE